MFDLVIQDYLIQVVDTNVEVSRIINSELEPMIIGGEKALSIDVFWPIFMEKIEYQKGEKLAFVIVSNNDNFELSPAIKIAEEFVTSIEDLSFLIDSFKQVNFDINLYPCTELSKEPFITTDTEENPKEDVFEECAPNSIQAFYRNKTKSLKREY